MNRFQRTWELFKSSLAVMRRDPRLLLFPIVTAACTVLVALLFLVPVAFQRTGYSWVSAEHWTAVSNSLFANAPAAGGSSSSVAGSGTQGGNAAVETRGLRPLAVGYFALLYFVSMFCATFFNVAFYQQILNALAGGRVSLLEGLGFAASRWQSILMWTLFAGLVGYLIKTLEERFGFVGRLVLRLLGTAWSVACVFVIPVLVTEEETVNPLVVLKKSALTLKQTWGESLIGYAGVSFGGLILLLASLVWLGCGVAAGVSLHVYWLIPVWVLAWLAAICIWSYLLSVASQIFRCALFVYATRGVLPAPYTPEMVAVAWKAKRQ